MNFNNPLEILLTIILILGSIWIVEKIITGAFKTIIAAVVIVAVLAIYTNFFHPEKKPKNRPEFRFNDLTNYEEFKKKFNVLKQETINDIKKDYKDAKKNKNDL